MSDYQYEENGTAGRQATHLNIYTGGLIYPLRVYEFFFITATMMYRKQLHATVSDHGVLFNLKQTLDFFPVTEECKFWFHSS